MIFMKKVMAFGTFDILHAGHLHYLREAKKHGTWLTVIITNDRNVRKSKGNFPVNDQHIRKELVESLKMVDGAVIGDEKDYYKVVEEVKPQVIALGYDQAERKESVEKELRKRGFDIEVVRITPHKEDVHKSSKIKGRIRKSG